MEWALCRVPEDDPDKDVRPFYSAGYIPVPWPVGTFPDHRMIPITEQRALQLIADIYAAGEAMVLIENGRVGRSRDERYSAPERQR